MIIPEILPSHSDLQVLSRTRRQSRIQREIRRDFISYAWNATGLDPIWWTSSERRIRWPEWDHMGRVRVSLLYGMEKETIVARALA